MFSPLVGVGGIPGLGMTVDAMLAFAQAHPLAVQWMDKPFDQLVAEHIADPKARRLIAALTGYVSDGSETLSCAQMVPLFGYYFHGGYHPLGGSGKFAGALADAVRKRGGEVRLNSAIRHIDVRDGRAAGVTFADGKQVSARAVVSNADLRRTFLDLIYQNELPAEFRARVAETKSATSAFTVHLGVDFVPDIRPAVHVEGASSIGITMLSRIDPTAAPAGHSTLTITALQPHAQAAEWFSDGSATDWDEARRTAEYGARKKQIGDRLIEIAEKVVPGLSAHIVYRDEASPLTFARYDWSTAGSIYGVAQKDRLKGVKSPIPGLVVAGSSTHGPGVEAALISGAFAADALLPGLLARPPSNVVRITRTAA
jgi:all-trans-retinol 13,14-reductase